jgi:hypothetical protein
VHGPACGLQVVVPTDFGGVRRPEMFRPAAVDRCVPRKGTLRRAMYLGLFGSHQVNTKECNG